MRSFICNPLTRHSVISHSASRNKSLTLTLLVSFCLTYMGQAFATPMVCMMPMNDMANASTPSPCHLMMSESNIDHPSMADTGAAMGMMDCCDASNSDSDSGLTITSQGCTCADSGCGASLIFIASFSCSSLSISEQSYFYSTIGFPNQIDSTLFRPPIA